MKKLRRASEEQPPVAVIEEGLEQLYSIRFMLESLGYRVLAPRPGVPLQEWLKETRPAVVVVDMMLPGNSALALIRGLRKAGPAGLRIVAVTAEVVTVPEHEIREAGADDLLVKPYSVSELQEKVHL